MPVGPNYPKLVVMFYGRFQPPHIGHMTIYWHLIKKFNEANVYIGTSNKTDGLNSPLTFTWKQKIFGFMGVTADHIIQTRQNYKPSEIATTLGLDPRNTIFIIALGEKDQHRLDGEYYRPYDNLHNMVDTMDNQGYYYVVPNVELNGSVVHSTTVRDIFRHDYLSVKDYADLKHMMGITKAQANVLKPLFKCDIMTEGALGGHMSHPYEDMNMTFGDMKNLITLALSGELTREVVTEKIDGMNLFASIVNGKLVLGRNKSNIANRGKDSMSIDDMSQRWLELPAVQSAFIEGAKTLESELLKLTVPELEEIFDNGSKWINFEVVWNTSKNVIDYDRNMLVLHSVTIVDENGVVVGADPVAQVSLFKKLSAVKSDNVETPIQMTIKQDLDFSRKRDWYIKRLTTFQNKYRLSDAATLGNWVEAFWEKKISRLERKYASYCLLPQDVKMRLVNRLANDDRTYRMSEVGKAIMFAPLKNDVQALLKSRAEMTKEAIAPIELLFLELGADVLMNVEAFVTANPDKTLDSLRADIADKISQIKKSNDIADLEKMRALLQKIEALGGLKKLVPAEGIVFKWNGKVYKLTGLFAPLNQLMGIGRFRR